MVKVFLFSRSAVNSKLNLIYVIINNNSSSVTNYNELLTCIKDE